MTWSWWLRSLSAYYPMITDLPDIDVWTARTYNADQVDTAEPNRTVRIRNSFFVSAYCSFDRIATDASGYLSVLEHTRFIGAGAIFRAPAATFSQWHRRQSSQSRYPLFEVHIHRYKSTTSWEVTSRTTSKMAMIKLRLLHAVVDQLLAWPGVSTWRGQWRSSARPATPLDNATSSVSLTGHGSDRKA